MDQSSETIERKRKLDELEPEDTLDAKKQLVQAGSPVAQDSNQSSNQTESDQEQENIPSNEEPVTKEDGYGLESVETFTDTAVGGQDVLTNEDTNLANESLELPNTEGNGVEATENQELEGNLNTASTEKVGDVESDVAEQGSNQEHSEKPDRVTIRQTNVPFDRLVVLNLEATCDENKTNPAAVQVTKENSEVVEFSFVVLNGTTLEILHQQSIYVRPERTPLTSFCTGITGIKWEMLASAGSLKDAVGKFDEYVQTELKANGHSFCLVTHGGWGPRIQLPREARDKGIELPGYLAFCCMFDLKQEIQRWQVHHPETSLHTTSLRELCDSFNVTRVTTETTGLNNCLTITNIVRYLTDFKHPDVFVHPIDTNADMQQFKREESNVIHLAGLPFEVTQGELEAWFSSNGLRPINMSMFQPTDHSKPSISGFVVFSMHSDAMRALSLNGRCLGDRPIEVSPSSERVIDAAGNMLVPFPVQAKTRQRPGDWSCSNCSFYNFASRRYCFKCNTENPSPSSAAAATTMPAPAPSSAHHPTNFVAGDWMCPNHACNFHNYASRSQCFRCGTSRPGAGSGVQAAPMAPNPGYGRPPPSSVFRPGDWYCPNPSCGFQNFASRTSCFKCHTASPLASQQQQQQQQHQQQQQQSPYYQQPPTTYGYSPEPGYNSGGNRGYGTSVGGYGGYGGGYASQPYGGSGGGPSAGGSGGVPFRPGDWYCPTCSAHNFASRTMCMKCSTPARK